MAPYRRLCSLLLTTCVLSCQGAASDDNDNDNGLAQGGNTAAENQGGGTRTGGNDSGGVSATGDTKAPLNVGGAKTIGSAKSGTATSGGDTGFSTGGTRAVGGVSSSSAGGGIATWSTVGSTTGGSAIASAKTSGSATGGFTASSSASGTATSGGVTSQAQSTRTTTTTAAGGSAGQSSASGSGGLGWPIDCELGVDCSVGYPDIDEDNQAFDCSDPGYQGHQGSDIGISWDAMDAGTDVYAALSGEVLWVFDGNYDRCPNDTEPSCQAPTVDAAPNVHSGYMVCTAGRDEYCIGTTYTTGCYWCFYGSNVVVIRHPNDPVVFATRYDHLRRGSIVVAPGQHVERGQKIAQVGSAGNSTGPHLHFEVWVGGFYQLAEPWAGTCGPNHDASLWDPVLGLP